MASAKIKTGVDGLDAVLSGGFPAHTSALLEAPPGTGKTTFCKQFAKAGLLAGQGCVYVSTSEPIQQVMANFSALSEAERARIFFIDGYSWRVPESTPVPSANVAVLHSLLELNDLTRSIKQGIALHSSPDKPCRVVIDSLSDMLLYAEPASVFKFLQLFVGIIKSSEAVAAIVLEQGLHDPKHVATISYICDGTIRLRLEGDKRSIYVERMAGTLHPLQWIPFRLGNQGIEMKVEDFFR